MEEPIAVSNAGLVLLAPFFPELFRRAGLLEGERFRGEAEAARGVLLLQWLVTERAAPPEPMLTLNQVLCGRDPAAPVPAGEPWGEATLALARGLLETVIQRWPRGATLSVAGLRGNFLQRPGRLRRGAEGWSLQVERRAYDVLLAELPWSFSVVRPAWMPEPLRVDWA